jgi:hypothetical protein
LAVRKGACSCDFMKCGLTDSNEVCQNGQCVKRPVKPNQIKFNSTYKPSLNDDSDLLIRLDTDSKAVIVNGCKSPVGNYKAFDDGSISFSSFAITGQFCKNDKDSVYIKALTNSVRFDINQSGMILYSKEGK